MSTPALPPTAATTLVILLGASAWPNSPGFQESLAFVHAAHGFKYYLLDPHGFDLPLANLLDLFDAPFSASDQLERLGLFLEQRVQTFEAAKQAVRDVMVYFVGHGGFVGPSVDFYLLPRRANASSLRASGMSIDALAEVLQEKVRQTRRYLFLDCCFAAAAFRAFQGGPDQTAIAKTLDAFGVQGRHSGFPRKGMGLLCSSDQKSPSLLLPDESCTMFSSALLDVLKNGDLHRPEMLSLRDIKELAQDRLAALPGRNAPRPGLYSPDQSEGDVADVPLFRNISVERERARQAEEAERAHLEKQVRLRQAKEAEQIPLPSEQADQAPDDTPPTYQSTRSAQQSSPTPTMMSTQSPSVHAVLPPQDPAPHFAPVQTAVSLEKRTPVFPSRTSKQQTRRRFPFVIGILSLLIVALVVSVSVWTFSIRNSGHGNAWVKQSSGSSDALVRVIWAGSQFVAVGENGTILTSPDARIWTKQFPDFSDSSAVLTGAVLTGVAWSGSQFVAVGLERDLTTSIILTSPNARTWTKQSSDNWEFLSDVAWSGSQFVIVGGDATVTNSSIILTSPDTHTWTKQSSDNFYEPHRVIWSGSQFVITDGDSSIFTSPDARTWTKRDTGSHSAWQGSVVWSGSEYVTVGRDGTILTSPDARTWTKQPSGSSAWLKSVVRSGSVYVAVGQGGTILTSPDARTWTKQPSGSSAWLNDVAWSGSLFVAVGQGGTILISP